MSKKPTHNDLEQRIKALEEEVEKAGELQAALRESEEKFHVLADATPTAVMLYQDDRYIYVNRAAEIISGYSAEELIGMHSNADKKKLLETIKPPYLVLKPGLLGGIAQCTEWIDLARESKTECWITSALETNIGLNAIAQWTYTLNNPIAHGLSTGSLYTDNIPSPLYRYDDRLYYDPDRNWDLSDFTNV